MAQTVSFSRLHPIVDHRSVVTAGAVLVDVREPAEVAAGSLPGAVNIPLGELPYRVAELHGATTVVVFCRSGGRSATAAKYLVDNRFTDVVDLAGGMLAWDATA